jgi:hypothetical protein
MTISSKYVSIFLLNPDFYIKFVFTKIINVALTILLILIIREGGWVGWRVVFRGAERLASRLVLAFAKRQTQTKGFVKEKTTL